MIDEIFSCPIRKYHLHNEEIIKWAVELYQEQVLKQPSPLQIQISNMDGFVTPYYVDILEQFVKELGLEKTHVGLITGLILSGLDKGEYQLRSNTLPSHYTATHYIKGSCPDVYHHPARTLLQIFNPGLDEWTSAMSLYVNEGDIVIHPSYLEYSTPKLTEDRLSLTILITLAPRE